MLTLYNKIQLLEWGRFNANTVQHLALPDNKFVTEHC